MIICISWQTEIWCSSTVLTETLRVAQLVKKFPAIYACPRQSQCSQEPVTTFRAQLQYPVCIPTHCFINNHSDIITPPTKKHEDNIQAADSEFPIVASVRSVQHTRETNQQLKINLQRKN
jgi:hypothetical protein